MDKTQTLAAIREEAFQRKDRPDRFGRGGVQKNRLLDDSDNNLGNGVICNPQQAPTIDVETNPPRILPLDSLSPTAQMVTVTLTNRYLNNPPVAGLSFGGPIVAILEFGNGSIFTRVEVDVPLGRVGFAGHEPQDGGTVLSLPAGTLRVYARNDGNLIPSTIDGVASGIPNGAALTSAPISLVGARSTYVQAHVDYFTRPSAKNPTRTVHLYISPGAAQPFGSPLLKDLFPIPPFAKSVRILRTPQAGVAVSILFFAPENQAAIIETATVAAGATSPLLEVPGNAFWFALGPGAPITQLAAEFQIGF